MTRGFIAVFLALFLTPSLCRAQSAEETVAYLTAGLEDGRSDAEVVVRRIATSPATYDVKVLRYLKYGPPDVFSNEYEVEQLSDCRFRLTTRYASGRVGKTVVDFSLATTITHSEPTFRPATWGINFSGCVWVFGTSATYCDNRVSNFNGGDFDRAVAMLAHLRANVCHVEAS